MAEPILRLIAQSTVKSIVTPLSGVVLVMSAGLFALGRSRDATFLLSTILLNTFLAVIQEVRAKQALERLQLLSPAMAVRKTNRGNILISIEEIRVGDELLVQAGDAIQADGVILHSESCYINESQLTGESHELAKKKGDQLFAGSSVTAGTASFRVTAAASSTRIGAMERELRKVHDQTGPLQRDLARMLRAMGGVAVLLAISVALDSYFTKTSLPQTLSIIAASALTLVPQGIILASTLLAAYGAVRLGRHGVIVQHLTAIEEMGRLDILCLDKTGTLTELTAKLLEVHPVFPFTEHRMQKALASLASHPATSSHTLDALKDYLTGTPLADVVDTLAFTSTRKMSAAHLHDRILDRVVSLGAPEILSAWVEIPPKLQAYISQQTSKGNRVLLLADHGPRKASIPLEKQVKSGGSSMGCIVFSSPLRPGADDVCFYLQSQGITLKIISGDAPATVAAVAKRAGIRHTSSVLTGDELAALDPYAFDKAVLTTTIFARVVPEQKEQIIASLQRQSKTVGMIGDGVNDSLAIKRADIGIAMAAGSAATKTVADVVLLTNSYESVPLMVRTSNQMLVALQQVASLFGSRIIYTTILTVLSLAVPWLGVYPLDARQLLLSNWLTIGLPTLLWSIAPPEAGYRLRTDQFFRQVLRYSAPTGIAVGFSISVAWILCRIIDATSIPTAVTLASVLTASATAWFAPQALGATSTKMERYSRFILVGGVGAFLLLCWVSPSLAYLFGINGSISGWLTGIISGIVGWVVAAMLLHTTFPGKSYTL